MVTWVLQRLGQAVIVSFAMTVVVFFGVSVVGNPIDSMVSPDATFAERQAVIENLGLNLPLWQQYLVFLKGVLSLNFGTSFVYGEPALQIIAARLPATVELAFAALIMTIIIGIPLGLYAGMKPNSVASKVIMTASVVGFSIPGFWVGILFVMFFGVQTGWLPTSGRGETISIFGQRWSLFTLDGLSHLLLPAATMALSNICMMIRLTRAGIREALLQEYVKFARAKGLSEKRVVGVYALKNIMIPIVTVIGLDFGGLIAFAIVTESIFAWPGIGKLIIDSIRVLDRPMIVAYLMMTGLMFIFINLVVDIIYSILDPRITLGQGGN